MGGAYQLWCTGERKGVGTSEHKGIGNMGTRGHTRQDSWMAWELMRGACWDLLGTHGGIHRG